MPAPKVTSSLDPITFKDFTPGIADLPGVNYKPESATRDNTYRCIANHSGALVPLPYGHRPFTLPPVTSPTSPIAVTGLYIPPIGLLPKTDSTVTFTPGEFPEHELFVGTEWLTAGGATMNHLLYRYRRYETPGDGYDVIKSTTNTHAGPFRPTGMNFASTRSNRADPFSPGVPVTIIQGFGYLSAFPDDQNPSSLTPFDIATGFFPTPGAKFILHMTTHQGRTVLQELMVWDHGPDTITFVGENVTWSFTNDVTPDRWGTWDGLPADGSIPDGSHFDTTPKVFIPEQPSGFAVMVSMSANELFFVKGAHGGGYITGSLDTGTVVSLPMVTGAEVAQMATVCPLGVAYGNRTSGMWVWSHGDNSTLISPQMLPNFWSITGTDPVLSSNPDYAKGHDLDEFGGVAYSFATCDDWVLTPNNFLFDCTQKSWWRLEDPARAQFRWVTSNWHYIYASDSYYTNDDRDPVWLYKREWKSPSYSWQSHPIWQSVEDIVSVTDIGLIAEGQGEVTLTLTTLDGQTNSITIMLDDCGFPERFRERLAITGKYIQLRIEAQTYNPDIPAPTVYSVTLYPFTEAPIGHTQ